ncbi:MAG: D-TA family PLP-dependent enzyme [Planctomycetaceae bacterium]|nr:D-TA family PLP-dependent enzyme [Planctomycetaceae bacterium]
MNNDPNRQGRYRIEGADSICSPALVVFRELVEHNLDTMLRVAGSADRLRPHCKTTKMAAVAKMLLSKGVSRHKCATFAEAEMLAGAGARDIFLGYNVVGPNIERAAAFLRQFPDVSFAVTADDERSIGHLGEVIASDKQSIGVLLDIDPGRERTGVRVGQRARELYALIDRTPGLRAEGLHLYDGHQRQKDLSERRLAVDAEWRKVAAFRDELLESGHPVPRIVCGGTPTFPVYAEIDDPAIELSPGTCVFHDAGYGEAFPDLEIFTPAAVILTRVVSRPTANRVTFDVGTKAVASDPPMGERVVLPEIPDAVQVVHNEEHLVVETADAARWKPGDLTVVIPRHVCPTVAHYDEAVVIERGTIVDHWPITARGRRITV